MRVLLFAGAAMLATAFAAEPMQAQGGAFMWCQATADNGVHKVTYYSAFFSAGAHEVNTRARAFKSEIEDEQFTATLVTAKCMAPADYDAAVAARNAAMKATPGRIVSWAG